MASLVDDYCSCTKFQDAVVLSAQGVGGTNRNGSCLHQCCSSVLLSPALLQMMAPESLSTCVLGLRGEKTYQFSMQEKISSDCGYKWILTMQEENSLASTERDGLPNTG